MVLDIKRAAAIIDASVSWSDITKIAPVPNANDAVKKVVEKHSLSEDSKFEAEAEVQKVTDQHTSNVEQLLKQKESEIMTV